MVKNIKVLWNFLLALVVVGRRRWVMGRRMMRSWGEGGFIWGVVGRWGGEVAAARDRQLEAVNVESLLVGVGKQSDKVVLLKASRVVVGVDE